MKRALAIGILLLPVGALIHALVWGRLLMVSPIVVGFEHQDLGRGRVYFHDGTDISQFRHLDAIIAEVERTHGMTFARKVEVFACASDGEHARISGSHARFCAIPVYGRVSVSKRAQEEAAAGKIHLDVYLTHELSHSLLFQHMPLMHFVGFPDWLLEGLAVLNAGQRGVDGYLTKEDVCHQMRQGHFLHPSEFVVKPWRTTKALREFDLPDKYYFIYSEMACFVEDLIQRGGEKKFTSFLSGLLEGKEQGALFSSIYGRSFDVHVEEFRERMNADGPPANAEH